MAIQDKTLRGAEHDYFATRSGVAGNASLEQHKRVYFQSVTSSSTNNLIQLERIWMQKQLNSTDESLASLWEKAASKVDPTVVSRDINQNKFVFYTKNADL